MTDYATDVKKYAPGADDKVIAAIVKHLGIALRNKDSSLVSCSDKTELDRVRDGWCKKKLALTDDKDIEAALKSVCEKMKADKTKSRVTFYYLVAEHYKKLGALVA